MAAIETSALAASTMRRSERGMRSSFTGGFKVGQLAEECEALIDLLTGDLLQPLGAEALDGERAHDASVEHGVAEGGRCELFLRCDVAKESAGEAVACAG